MPELPEVETIARTLAPLVQGRRITGVTVLLPKTVDAGSLPLAALTGRSIEGTARRGKLALLRLVSDQSGGQGGGQGGEQGGGQEAHMLAVHLKMTGRLFVYGENQEPGPHTRIILDLQEGQDGQNGQGMRSRLFFDDARTFGYVRLLSPATLAHWPFWQKLGLEPLDHSPAALAARMGDKRGGIKGLLLDQSVVAGIGNIYADEALFRTGIDPRRKAHTLSLRLLETLFAHIQEVLAESIRQCGSSIRDYRTARGDAGAFQNTFRVYGRTGQPCVSCQHILSTAKVAGRTTVFCAHCQK